MSLEFVAAKIVKKNLTVFLPTCYPEKFDFEYIAS
jgi:hypothetical protein